MIRGTTPVHVFTTDIDLSPATILFVTYEQNRKMVVEKTIDDAVITPESVTVTLSQSDTIKFNDAFEVEIQIRVGFADGSRLASNIINTTVERILKDGEI